MNFNIITKESNGSDIIRFTYTKDETRIKIYKNSNNDIINFSKLVSNYLESLKFHISLRGVLQDLGNNNYSITLSDSTGNKNDWFYITGNKDKILEIKNIKEI